MWQWISDNIVGSLEWTVTVTLIPIIALTILGWAARRTRAKLGGIVMGWSWFPSATCWFVAAVVLYAIWGWTGFIIGVLLVGIGVIPLALLATAIHGVWPAFGLIFYYAFLCVAARWMGVWMLASSPSSKPRSDDVARGDEAAGVLDDNDFIDCQEPIDPRPISKP